MTAQLAASTPPLSTGASAALAVLVLGLLLLGVALTLALAFTSAGFRALLWNMWDHIDRTATRSKFGSSERSVRTASSLSTHGGDEIADERSSTHAAHAAHASAPDPLVALAMVRETEPAEIELLPRQVVANV